MTGKRTKYISMPDDLLGGLGERGAKEEEEEGGVVVGGLIWILEYVNIKMYTHTEL